MKKPKPEPKPRPDVLAEVARQSGTNREDWRHLSPRSLRWAQGFRYWNPTANLYAKRDADNVPESSEPLPERDLHASEAREDGRTTVGGPVEA